MRKTTLAFSLMLFGATVLAEVTVKDSWVRGTTPAQKATGAFMEIASSEAASLLSAASPLAGVVEVHSMKMEDGVMKMRALPKLDLPAGKAVKLQPGGNHIMLMDLRQQMKKGDVVPITLKVEGKDKKVQTIEIKAEVRDLATPAMMDHGHKH
jgi:copper(I)-binding protein